MADTRRAYLAGGHVYCRVRREDMDIADCRGCERLVEIQLKSSPPYLVCDLSGHRIDDDEAIYASWRYRHHRRLP